MEIKELHSLSDTDWAAIDELMKQLTNEHTVTRSMIQEVLQTPGSHLFAMFDGDAIIGCATLCVFVSPTGRKADIEDVVVAESYRGRHLGRELLEFLIDRAREQAPIDIHLTSRPARIAANALYQSLGFQKRDTNVYKLSL